MSWGETKILTKTLKHLRFVDGVKPTVVILIPVWKRFELFEFVLGNLLYLIEAEKERTIIKIAIVASEEDSEYKRYKEISNPYTTVFTYKNLPVGEKVNAGIDFVMDNYRFDYLMNFGSDDLIHPNLMDIYEPYMRHRIKFFGIDNLYFINSQQHKAYLYHRKGTLKSVGAGRMIHYSVLEYFKQKNLDLYEPEKGAGLDGSSAKNILKHLKEIDLVIPVGSFPYIVDIKSEVNINSSFLLENHKLKIQYVPLRKVTDRYPYLDFNFLNK
jgi:hypothetical protein